MKIISRVELNKIIRRFYPLGKVLGHAYKALQTISNKEMKPLVEKATPLQQSFDKDFMSSNLDIIKQTDVPPPSNVGLCKKQHKHHKYTPISKSTISYYTQKVLQVISSIKTYKESTFMNIDHRKLHAIQGKEALHYFLPYFENLPKQFVRDPVYLMIYFRKLTEKLPKVQVRAFQLALEIYLRKNLFLIENITNKNGGLPDIGTFFSALQANHLYTQPGFKDKVDTCVVIATCIQMNDLAQLPPDILKHIQEIQKAMGNTVNNIVLKGPHFAHNHINLYL